VKSDSNYVHALLKTGKNDNVIARLINFDVKKLIICNEKDKTNH